VTRVQYDVIDYGPTSRHGAAPDDSQPSAHSTTGDSQNCQTRGYIGSQFDLQLEGANEMLAVPPRVRGACINIVKKNHSAILDDASLAQQEQVTLVKWLKVIKQNQIN
jgi:uncharacterized RmlC-like cupin family protein